MLAMYIGELCAAAAVLIHSHASALDIVSPVKLKKKKKRGKAMKSPR